MRFIEIECTKEDGISYKAMVSAESITSILQINKEVVEYNGLGSEFIGGAYFNLKGGHRLMTLAKYENFKSMMESV